MIFDVTDIRSVQAVDQWRARVEEHARATASDGRVMSALGIRGPGADRARPPGPARTGSAGAAGDGGGGSSSGGGGGGGGGGGRRRPASASGFAPAVVNAKGLPPMLLLANKGDLRNPVIKPADLDNVGGRGAHGVGGDAGAVLTRRAGTRRGTPAGVGSTWPSAATPRGTWCRRARARTSRRRS